MTINLIRVSNGSTPIATYTTTAGANGAWGPVTVTAPSTATPGLYVIYAICTVGNYPMVQTVALVIAPAGATATHFAVPSTFTASPTVGSPAVQAAVNQAVSAAAAPFAATAAPSPAPAGHATKPSGPIAFTGAYIALEVLVALALVTAGLLALRRRRPTAVS
ncbi:MAG TPA: hypothetical protein VFA11_14795 [Acidimicrobiales bacterium]|nr:hypothetical protein [Acidimicrobiales bacterium]